MKNLKSLKITYIDICVALILLFYLFLRIYNITSIPLPLVHDDGLHFSHAKNLIASPFSALYDIQTKTAHPPLYLAFSILLIPIGKHYGSLVFLINVLWWFSASVLIYYLFRNRWKRPSAGLVFISLLSTHQLVIVQIYEYRVYLYLILGIICLFALYDKVKLDGYKKLYWLVLFGTFYSLFHFSTVITIATLFIGYFPIQKEFRKSITKWVVCHSLMLAPVSALVLFNKYFRNKGSNYVSDRAVSFLQSFDNVAHLMSNSGEFYPVFVVLFCFGLVYLFRTPRLRPLFYSIIAILSLLICLNYLNLYPLTTKRWSALLLPFLFIAISAVTAIPSKSRHRALVASGLSLLIILNWSKTTSWKTEILTHHWKKVASEIPWAIDTVRKNSAGPLNTTAAFASFGGVRKIVPYSNAPFEQTKTLSSHWAVPKLDFIEDNPRVHTRADDIFKKWQSTACECFFELIPIINDFHQHHKCDIIKLKSVVGVCCNKFCQKI